MSDTEPTERPVCAYCGVSIRYRETMVERGVDVYCCMNCAEEDQGTELTDVEEERWASRTDVPTNAAQDQRE